jgi:Holliday junction resolvase RusA-like endonuclease
MISIIIPGKPIAKARPRFARRGKFVKTYSAQETEESLMMWEVYRQLPDGWQPLKCPIKIITNFYLPRPKAHYGTGKNAGKLKSSAPLFHTQKPDVDNLQKMVYDCLNGVVWGDDATIYNATANKMYSENPRTEIIIDGDCYA